MEYNSNCISSRFLKHTYPTFKSGTFMQKLFEYCLRLSHNLYAEKLKYWLDVKSVKLEYWVRDSLRFWGQIHWNKSCNCTGKNCKNNLPQMLWKFLTMTYSTGGVFKSHWQWSASITKRKTHWTFGPLWGKNQTEELKHFLFKYPRFTPERTGMSETTSSENHREKLQKLFFIRFYTRWCSVTALRFRIMYTLLFPHINITVCNEKGCLLCTPLPTWLSGNYL